MHQNNKPKRTASGENSRKNLNSANEFKLKLNSLLGEKIEVKGDEEQVEEFSSDEDTYKKKSK